MPIVLAELAATGRRGRAAISRTGAAGRRARVAGAPPLGREARLARVDWRWARVGQAERFRSRAGQPALRLEPAVQVGHRRGARSALAGHWARVEPLSRPAAELARCAALVMSAPAVGVAPMALVLPTQPLAQTRWAAELVQAVPVAIAAASATHAVATIRAPRARPRAQSAPSAARLAPRAVALGSRAVRAICVRTALVAWPRPAARPPRRVWPRATPAGAPWAHVRMALVDPAEALAILAAPAIVADRKSTRLN